MSEKPEPAKPTYAYKPSLTGAARYFELDKDGLVFRSGYRAGVWQYRDVVSIRLSYRPISMLSRRFRADIRNADGKVLTLISSTWTSIALVTPQDESYRLFVAELHNRVQAAGAKVSCVSGLQPIIFSIAALALGIVMLAIGGLFVRAMATGAAAAGLFMLGFAVWFGWTIGRWLFLNKPRRYDPSHLPQDLMP